MSEPNTTAVNPCAHGDLVAGKLTVDLSAFAFPAHFGPPLADLYRAKTTAVGAEMALLGAVAGGADDANVAELSRQEIAASVALDVAQDAFFDAVATHEAAGGTDDAPEAA